MLQPLLVLLLLLPFLLTPQQPAPVSAPSAIPADAKSMVNPVKPTPESQARAKKMYGYDCAMCHGANGDGKGDVTDLKTKPKDYTDPAALKDLTDGEIFYILKNGKGQMPPDGDRTKPDDMWNMVILLRSFSKK